MSYVCLLIGHRAAQLVKIKLVVADWWGRVGEVEFNPSLFLGA